MKVLINCTGYIGDILFASSVAKQLHWQDNPGYSDHNKIVVDYLIHLYQPYELLCNNPFINKVYLFDCDRTAYDIVYDLHEIDFNIQPPKYYQMKCGIKNPTTEFEVYTNKAFDLAVEKSLKPFKDQGLKIVAYLSNWEERSFIFTEEEYKKGIDIPGYGYGGKHRNTDWIIEQLNNHSGILLTPVGMPPGYNVREADFNNVAEYSMQASFLKNCDYFIGAEGGLCNLAAGVGTKTIITGDFIHQLYGWNGVLRKIQEPKLGPEHYFTSVGHLTLNPYLTDKEVVEQIQNILNEK
jgi:hypothetical protein